MAEGDVRQYFIRNDKGTLWGPLALPTIELLLDNGIIQGRIQVSEDGINFAYPGRFPHLRDAFPRELWGDVIAPGATVQVAKAELPPEMLGQSAPAPVLPGAAPMAGPGAVSQAAAPRAGPGAIAQPAVPRPGPGAAPQAGAPRPVPGAVPQAGVPMANPGARAAPVPPGAVPGSPSGSFRPVAPPPGAMPPGSPSGSFRPVAPPGAGPRPPPATPQAGGAPAMPSAPGASPASAAPRPPPVMAPSGTHGSVAPAPAGPPGATAAPGASASARPAASQAPASPASVSTPTVGASPGVSEPALPAPPAQGSLDQLSPIALYGRISAGGLTGLLSLTLPDRSVQIHFRKGSPEFVDSTHPEDALGTMLLQAKLLSAEQLQQAEGARPRFGGDLLTSLFGLGLLQPANTFNHLSQRALSILHKGLRAESGTFAYEPKDLPAAKAMPLGNRWAVLSEQVRRLPSVDLKRRLQPVLNLPIMKAAGVAAPSDLRLTPHEVRVLTVIDGVRSLAQLLADFPQDTEHILRLAFLLKELDAASFAAVPQRAPEPKAAAPNPPPATAPKPAAPHPPPAATAPKPAAPHPPPAAAAPAPGAPVLKPSAPAPASGAPVLKPSAPGAAPASSAPVLKPSAPPSSAPTAAATPAKGPGVEELTALRQTATVMKGQNLFERLGLAQQADAGAVKIAYFKLARLYHPDTLPPGAPPELEKLKAEIFGYIGDAYRTLTDDKSRNEYLEQLKSGDTGKEEVDVVAILQAEERFKRGTVYVKSRKYAEAVKIFDEAIQLNAEEAEFHAWRAYARFCAAPDKKAIQPESFKDLQAAIKKNERCVAAYYFLGVIAKTLGDATGALKHFRKTVELQPDH
ncbi:J domain-containing protein, partial [Hyalangium sp.]|uniref:J domain-containing protein n=1 Tax=Hyalangium sp. TaxID=2028555 RepID=UPI002D430B24